MRHKPAESLASYRKLNEAGVVFLKDRYIAWILTIFSSLQYCDQHVCLFVCPLAYLKKAVQTSRNSLYLLTVAVAQHSSYDNSIRYMYFRFCGWRHYFT